MKSFIRSVAITTGVAMMGILSLTGTALAQNTSLAFQGFETNTGDWNDYTSVPTAFRVPSGGGVLHLPAADGNYYAEVHNIDNDYIPGYFGDSGISLFGFTTQPPFPGNFSQSIKMYVYANWPVALYGGPGVWIDETPGSASGSFGAEHNFRLTPTGTAVGVFVDGQPAPIVTLTTSGWYNFQMAYQKGASPTALITTNMNVFDPSGNLVGTTTVVSNSPGGPTPSSDLLGPGYVWITVWPNGWANDALAIDDVRADLLTVCDGTGGPLNGNLNISSGQTCLLNGSTVSGNVTQNGGSLIATGSVITGNLQTTGGGSVTLNSSKVDGNLQIQNIVTGTGSVQVCGSYVGGGLQFHNNEVPAVIGSPSAAPPCAGNTVGGDLQVQNNTASVLIVGNTVNGNLQVQNNTGRTQVYDNTVAKSLQCQSNSQLTVAGPNTASQKQGCF